MKLKHLNSTPKHAEATKVEDRLEKDLSSILKRSDEKIKGIFERHDSSRGRDSRPQEDRDAPDTKP